MFTIRGENVYPSEIDSVLNEIPDYGGEHRIHITREGAMDELLLRVEPSLEAHADAGRSRQFKEEVGRRILKTLALRTVIELVEPRSIPRTDFKARRVVDDRDVFRELNQKLQGK